MNNFSPRFELWCIISTVHMFSLWHYRWQTSPIQKRRGVRWSKCPRASGHPETLMFQVTVCSTAGGTVLSPPWLQVDCCPSWPVHNEIYINGLCEHRIHKGCLPTINGPYSIEACPICVGQATHFLSASQFLLPLICIM